MKKQNEITVLPSQQDMVEVKEQISIVEIAAKELQINSQEDMNKATDILHNVKLVENLIEERKVLITRPLMASLASVRGLFAPLETAHKLAKQIIKEKMLVWSIAENERVEKEKEKISKKVSSGRMKAETAAGKLEEVGEVQTSSRGEVGKSSIRTIKKVRIVDETVIPRMYLIPNMTLITEDILRKGVTIIGTKTYEEKQIISR